jgi:hypothetical protein
VWRAFSAVIARSDCPPKLIERRRKRRSNPSSRKESWIASSQGLLAMTMTHTFAIPRRDASEFLQKTSALKIQRAQGMPGAQRARSLACRKKKAHERSHHGHTGNRPAFPAQWFYGLLRALPGDQACLTPSPALLIADLTPASGRQNHTTSPYAPARFVKRTDRVHRIPPRVDDVAQRPSVGRDGANQ